LGVISASGRRLQSMVVETNGRALAEAVRLIPGRVHLCVEEGTQSAWLYERLKPHVVEIVVSMPPRGRGAKDDRRDAWARAEELRVGAVETRVYKAPQQLAALRAAVRAVFAVRQRLATGAGKAVTWRALCARAGIADVELAAVAEPAGRADHDGPGLSPVTVTG
jgi:hypothetical protein